MNPTQPQAFKVMQALLGFGWVSFGSLAQSLSLFISSDDPMPVVPFTSRPDAMSPRPQPQVPDTFLMMAAADLHEAGRLFEPTGSLGFVQDAMTDDEYDNTWHHSEARKGRSDAEMKALYPELEAYRLGKDSDLISYHKKPRLGDLTS